MKKNPHPMAEPDPDYLEYLRDHREDSFVLAVTYPTLAGLGRAGEKKGLGGGRVMGVGREGHKILGPFSPMPSGPGARVIFLPVVGTTRKNVLFLPYPC